MNRLKTLLILYLTIITTSHVTCQVDRINSESYDQKHTHYTDTFVVELRDLSANQHHIAKRYAERHNLTHIHSFDNGLHVFRNPSIKSKSLQSWDIPAEDYNFHKDSSVVFIEQQKAKKRGKRSITRDNHLPYFNDPFYRQQWYLNRAKGLDLNTQEAWQLGYSGYGVVITILDDGIETDNPDISSNYDPKASYDINDQDPDPQPRYDISNENRHGTRCAGEVAAVANNSICIVGVAFRSKIGGVRMLDGDVTDEVEARALSLNPDYIDIYSASWGPDDDGKTLDGPARMAQQAFENGVTKGRRGLGSIFAWASGNGGRDRDNCNCDGYTNSRYTLSISSATESGHVPWYSEPCSSTLASTYSSGSVMEHKIVSTDLRHGCTESHTGTSASAPLAAGILALALEANPNLGWRDMQHLVVVTSNPDNLYVSDWTVNGIGRKVSHSFGYGMMDAGAMVKAARVWRNVPPANNCTIINTRHSGPIPPNGSIRFSLETDGCLGKLASNMRNNNNYYSYNGYNSNGNFKPGEDSDLRSSGEGDIYSYGGHVKYLEHVQARISLKAPERGQIEIFLTSPAGTTSKLLFKRPKDYSGAGINGWPFMTTHSWGELSYGTWILEITNGANLPGYLVEWSLIFHGTESQPETLSSLSSSSSPSYIRGLKHNSISDNQAAAESSSSRNYLKNNLILNCFKMLYPGHCLVCDDSYALYEGMCLKECPPNLYKSLIMTPPIIFPSSIKRASRSHHKKSDLFLNSKDESMINYASGWATFPITYYTKRATKIYKKEIKKVVKKLFSLICKTCDSSCKRCRDGGRAHCTECHDGYYLAKFSRKDEEESRTANSAECKACDVSCRTCDGISATRCTSCPLTNPTPPFPVLVDGHCRTPRSHGYVRSEHSLPSGNHPFTSIPVVRHTILVSVFVIAFVAIFAAFLLFTKNIGTRLTNNLGQNTSLNQNFNLEVYGKKNISENIYLTKINKLEDLDENSMSDKNFPINSHKTLISNGVISNLPAYLKNLITLKRARHSINIHDKISGQLLCKNLRDDKYNFYNHYKLVPFFQKNPILANNAFENELSDESDDGTNCSGFKNDICGNNLKTNPNESSHLLAL
ncbi:unnamed protein product [Gordionus sp. m RMFG-2023]